MMNDAMVAALRVEASVDGGKYVEGLQKIRRETKKAERDMAQSWSGIGKVVKAGIGGLVGALSVGLFVKITKEALDYAQTLKSVSSQLGVTTKDLQTLRYAASTANVSHAEFDKTLSMLAQNAGKAAAGSREYARVFKAIGIEADTLRDKDPADLFREVADAVARIESPMDRATVATKLFGENGAQLLPLLTQGSGGIDNLSRAAEQLGIVLSDEQIQKADATAEKLDAMQTVLSMKIAGAVADNADSILKLADSLVEVADAAIKALDAYSRFAATVNANGSIFSILDPSAQKFVQNGGLVGAISRQFSSPKPAARSAGFGGRGTPGGAGFGGKGRKAPPISLGNFLAPSGGGGKKRGRKGPDPERERLRALADANQFDQELRRAEMDIIRARQSLAVSSTERAALEIELLDLQRAAEQADLQYQVAAGEKTQEQADQIESLSQQTYALERQKIADELSAEAAEGRAMVAEEAARNEYDLLDSKLQLATTDQEERQIRMEMLDLYYRQQRAALEAVLADEKSSEYAKEAARQRLAMLGQMQANDAQGVRNSTMGPWESFLDSIPDTAAEAQEAMEALRVRGINGAVDALLQLQNGFGSFRDAAMSAIQDILAELWRMWIMKQILNIAGGGGGFTSSSVMAGGNVGFVGGVDTGPMGMANGGWGVFGGIGGIDRNVLSLNGQPIAKVSKGENFAVSPNRASEANVTINIGGNASRETVSQIASATKRAVASASRRGM